MTTYMRWLRLLSLSALLFLLGLSAVSASWDVSVPNGSFESDVNEDGIPDDWENAELNNILTNSGFEEGMTDWSTDGNNRNGIIDTTVFRSGTASARITGGVPWTGFRHRDIPIEPGATYLISAYVKTQDVTRASSKVFIHFGTRDQAGNWVKRDNSVATNPTSLVANKGTQDWHKVEMLYTAADNETYITYLRIRINSVAGADSEFAWFDDLVIRKAGGIDTTQSHTGDQSLKVTSVSSESVSTWLSGDVPVVGGRVYDVRSAIKTETPETTQPFYSVQFRMNDGRFLTQTVTSSVYEGDTGVADWSALTGTVIVPKDVQSARIGLNVQGSGSVWFDSVQMKENTTPTATRIQVNGPKTITISESGNAIAYTATVWDQYDQVIPSEAVHWSLDTPYPGVTIDPESGVLTVTGQTLSSSVQIRARSLGATDAEDRMTVVLAPRFTLQAVQQDGNWEVTIEGDHIGNLYAYELEFGYDLASVQRHAAKSLISDYATDVVTVADSVYFAGTLSGKSAPLQGKVSIAQLTLQPLASTPLILKSVTIVDSQLNAVHHLLDERLDLYAVEATNDAQPGKPVLSDNHGHSTGLRDGNYAVSMNMWWGNNGSEFRLYENDRLIDEQVLRPQGQSAQSAITQIHDRPDGVYVYQAELRNNYGKTLSDPLIVTVTHAAPGKPVLSHNNWAKDSQFQIMMNMWWGTNGSMYRLYENDELIEEQQIVASSPMAQSVTVTRTNRLPGIYTYRAALINDAGVTLSETLIVEVLGE